MIDVKCDKGVVTASVKGNVTELGADLLTIVHSIYTSVFNDDPILAVLMREIIEHNMSECFVMEDN